SSAPTSWTVEFEPETIPAVEPGTPVTITATITPSGDAIAGDYELTMTAEGEESTDEVEIRVRVETPQLWWIVGVGLIVAVFAGLYWVFRTYGRR
ncbi:MAG TPA: NEW3 domain-containing protein, partial [Candidatus Limnocylindrales bacterium]|nr:NEW3 domain-containing protein [Candidatus Limnocylindrales bacterium]